MYIKVVVVTSVYCCGKIRKALLATGFRTGKTVDKHGSLVDKPLHTYHPLLTHRRKLKPYPHQKLDYPQLSTTYPHIRAENAKARTLKILPNLLLNPVGQLRDLVIDRSSLGHQLTDFAIGVHDRCMVAPPECLADLWKGELG